MDVTGIDDLPNEVLRLIFANCHRAFFSLLLTCQRFNHLLNDNHSDTLWSKKRALEFPMFDITSDCSEKQKYFTARRQSKLTYHLRPLFDSIVYHDLARLQSSIATHARRDHSFFYQRFGKFNNIIECAAVYGHVEIFCTLAEMGQMSDQRVDRNVETYFCLAAKWGHLELLTFIYDNSDFFGLLSDALLRDCGVKAFTDAALNNQLAILNGLWHWSVSDKNLRKAMLDAVSIKGQFYHTSVTGANAFTLEQIWTWSGQISGQQSRILSELGDPEILMIFPIIAKGGNREFVKVFWQHASQSLKLSLITSCDELKVDLSAYTFVRRFKYGSDNSTVVARPPMLDITPVELNDFPIFFKSSSGEKRRPITHHNDARCAPTSLKKPRNRNG